MNKQLLKVNHLISLYYCPRRQCRSAKRTDELKSKEPPIHTERDWIGPPNSSSNLRPVKIYVPPDETKAEKWYRQLRSETEEWNQAFWQKHNLDFFQERKKFVETRKREKLQEQSSTSMEDVSLSPEELAVFYKRFLNNNYRTHMAYNTEWYKRNIGMLWPAFLATLDKLKRKLRQ